MTAVQDVVEANLRADRARALCIREEAQNAADAVRRAIQQWERFRMYGDEFDPGDPDNASARIVRELLSAAYYADEAADHADRLHNRVLDGMQQAGIEPGRAPFSPLWPDD